MLQELLDAYRPRTASEVVDVERAKALQRLTVAEASARTTESNLREFIARAGELFPPR
ncbi:hypothetical protein [Cryptosporangium minutisporangium]|uniref:Uncharacterized protein n=1 Tax=Cryptosporangium minutisporangium TaxID=113569 RepID=A0ABP6T891_9ACTN